MISDSHEIDVLCETLAEEVIASVREKAVRIGIDPDIAALATCSKALSKAIVMRSKSAEGMAILIATGRSMIVQNALSYWKSKGKK